MRIHTTTLAVALGVALALPAAQAATVDDLLARYTAAGAGSFDAARGESFWKTRRSASEAPTTRDCTTCHGADLTTGGKHVRTGKPIEPMAPSANAKRFTDAKKVEKWFRRNCKWTLGRECSAQEKGDVLSWLRGQ